jgi:NADPH:quinone reductase
MSSERKRTYRAIQMKEVTKSIEEGIGKLEIVELERAELGEDEVRVGVKASSLNFFDLLILVGKYQYKPEMPFVLGSEAAGEVLETGSKVTKWKIGEEVMVGMVSGGGTAEEIVVHENNLFHKPPQFSFAEAAALPVGFLTGYHGLVQRGDLRAGDYVLITGAAGGMGLSAVQIARRLGATVIAAASSQEKLDRALAAGAHFAVNYATEDLKQRVAEITDGHMADVIYEVVGGKVFKECVRCIASNGRLLVVGFAGGEIPMLPVNLVLIKGFQLVGVRSGAEMALSPLKAQQLWAEMIRLTSDHDRSLAPVTQCWSISDFHQAFLSVFERKIIGKATILWSSLPLAKL